MSVTAARLDEAMKARGWDQVELARRVEATQGAISKILVGKTSNSRLMPKIALQLGVSLGWLLGTTDRESPEAANADVTPEEIEWVRLLRSLPISDRKATVHLVRSLANCARSAKGAKG